MANLEIKLTTSNGSVTMTGPEISDANMARAIDFIWALYPQTDANGDELPRLPANEAAAFRDWARSIWRNLKRDVLWRERDIAAAAAQDAVGDIEE